MIMEKEPLGLIPANKMMGEILEIFETSSAEDFVLYDDFLKRIADKATKIVELYNAQGRN